MRPPITKYQSRMRPPLFLSQNVAYWESFAPVAKSEETFLFLRKRGVVKKVKKCVVCQSAVRLKKQSSRGKKRMVYKCKNKECRRIHSVYDGQHLTGRASRRWGTSGKESTTQKDPTVSPAAERRYGALASLPNPVQIFYWNPGGTCIAS